MDDTTALLAERVLELEAENRKLKAELAEPEPEPDPEPKAWADMTVDEKADYTDAHYTD